ncbi:Hsp33 family molecular chaperone HslO [Qipengyuania sediminis]|uniref:Hsp33 family molecular chaperone HslO n=1 Tax=Qipengyuania sediminis TaxID=1532023 RepID=UPI00105A7146|nr:Hsp33 family molecular chaperone HslO [Qipengyuania sediminis]
MTAITLTHPEITADQVLGFTIPGRHARGRMVRLEGVLDTILSAHAYPPPVAQLLAEALVLTALAGALLKDDGSQATVQAQTEGGPVSLLVCDVRGDELRGYVQFDAERIAELGPGPSLEGLFGKGYLAVTFDLAGGQGRYQGIVPLEGASLAEATQGYFVQSEQVPTLIRIGAEIGGEGRSRAAGMLVQHLPEGEDGRERLHTRFDHPEWEHVAALAGSLRANELLDPELTLDALVWRLFHEEDEVRVFAGPPLARGCRCSAAHYEEVIGRFPEEDRAAMRNDAGEIVANCAFCSSSYVIRA